MAFYYILLGHLIGDFALQTNSIALNKPFSYRWNLFHSMIVTLCMVLFAAPFGIITALLVLLAGVLHFAIDRYKPIVAARFKIPELPAFLGDQALHLLIIAAVSAYPSPGPALLLLDHYQVRFLLVLAVVVFFAAIFNQILFTGLFPKKDRVFLRKGEKQAGIAMRLLFTLGIYLAYQFNPGFLFLLPLGAGILFAFQRLSFSCGDKTADGKEFVQKLLLDGSVSIAGACVLIFLG